MMKDFNINYGLSSELFIGEQINPDLIIEVGCWYLCTDTAELFLGVNTENGLTLKRINEAEIHQIPVKDLALKSDVESVKQEVIQTVTPDVEAVKTKVETVLLPKVEEEIAPAVEELKKTVSTQRYEVLPVEGMLVSYREGEVRLNTQRVTPVKQSVGATGNPNMFYVTFRAYAPKGATRVIEGLIDGSTGKVNKDTEFSTLSTDSNGRKYTTIWPAVASTADGGTTWTKWGDSSNVNKYLGHRYVLDWYDDEKLIETARFSVILTNDACHDDLVSDAVTKRIIEKVNTIDLSGYAKKSDIPNTDGFVTKNELDTAISSIEHPTINLDNYVTRDEIENFVAEIPAEYITEEELEAKVLFTKDKFVSKAFGGFAVGDSLKDYTVAELFAKLLELTDTPIDVPDEPDEPEIPDEPESVIDDIIINKLPMYSVDDEGNIVTKEFEKLTFDSNTAELAPEKSGFYQIIENGEVIESGYQDIMSSNDSLYYVVALPKGVDYTTMVKLQEWDNEDGWNDCSVLLPLTSDPAIVADLCDEVGIDISHIDTELYTVWAMEDVCTGSKLRFIIEEDN